MSDRRHGSAARTSEDNQSRHDPIRVDARLYDTSEVDYDLEETFSVTSSVYEYEYENGRRYHSYRSGAYPLPNDETEQDRLDVMHHIYLMLLGGELHLTPISQPKRILDVGTGTGIWAINMADLYPDAEVVGTDLSPIQPEWVPPNCRFEVDDAESEWTFRRDYFDYIHSRHLGSGIRDWPGYVARLYAHTAPGGYIEMAEHTFNVLSDDGTYPPPADSAAEPAPASALHRYMALVNAASTSIGKPDQSMNLKQFVREAGFVDVREIVKKLPWGPWPEEQKMKELGHWTLLTMGSGLEAFGMALLTRIGGMRPEEARKLCEDARKDLRNRRIHVFNYHYIVIGRKPF